MSKSIADQVIEYLNQLAAIKTQLGIGGQVHLQARLAVFMASRGNLRENVLEDQSLCLAPWSP